MLFSPIRIKDLNLKNRVIMAPMCQYSATENGYPTAWHPSHYISRAVGGVGLIILEATAVESRGRISGHDLGLWEDAQIEPLKNIVDECKRQGAAMGVQLAHAGRKCEVKTEQPVAPSSMEWNSEYKTPAELTKDEIKVIANKFKASAKRTLEANFDVIELHAAHGYLIHEFLSPLSNKRTDEYGGTTENRVRFLQEVISAVREVWPSNKPLFVRVSADDYSEGGIDINEMVNILKYIKNLDVDLIHVSSGGLVSARITAYPGYQVKYSETIKKELGFATAAVGLITEPLFAEEILDSGKADMIALGRELLREPYWCLEASKQLNEEIKWPVQYERAKI